MTEYRLRSDLRRTRIRDYAFPLGLIPRDIRPPIQGYTVRYVTSEEDAPDTYAFHVVVTHERVAEIFEATLALLPPEVEGILEVNSFDAYRQMDVYLSDELISREQFRRCWSHYRPFFLEDGTVGVGAKAEEPFVEVFLDQWKGISIHVPLSLREAAESVLESFELEEAPMLWTEEEDPLGDADVQHVLDTSQPQWADFDDIILDLRHELVLALNVDPDENLDEAGRDLGFTLWHGVIIVDVAGHDAPTRFMTLWATARSIHQVMDLVEHELDAQSYGTLQEVYTLERVAYDERPEALADLEPRLTEARLHRLEFDA
jgi:hypothetical protein